MKKIFTFLFLLPLFFAAKSQSASTTIVVSQVYGGGGSTTASPLPAYKDDYIELHNVSSSSVTLPDWALFYGSQTGNIGGATSSRIKLPKNLIIPAGAYYLVQILSTDSATVSSVRVVTQGAALPVPADLVVGTPGGPVGPGYFPTVAGSPSMSGTNAKIVLSNDTTLFNCGKGGPGVAGGVGVCPAGTIARIVDLVGYGKLSDSLTTNFEGWVSQGVAGDTMSVLNGKAQLNVRVVAVRKNNGCQDTQNNFADFDTIPYAVPRNSQSPVNICLSTNPVKLNGFTIQKSNSIVALNWSTEQEFNNKEFIVERSNDGVIWAEIKTITAAGNSSSTKNYSTSDNAPINGFNYYRLKQINTDGSYNLSAIKKVLFSSNYKVLISPNPAKDFFNIDIAKNAGTSTTVKVTDMNGKVVRTVNSSLSTINISTIGLAKGMYVVKIADAKNISTQKVTVQ